MVFEGAYDTFEIPNPGLYPPTGGEQTSNVVITGDSSGIVFKNMPVGPGIGTNLPCTSLTSGICPHHSCIFKNIYLLHELMVSFVMWCHIVAD